MGRAYKRKTNKGLSDPQNLLNAIEAVRFEKMSIRGAAKTFGVKFQTVFKKLKALKGVDNYNVSAISQKLGRRTLFTAEQEESFNNSVITCAQMNVGLTPEEVCRLAFEMATIDKIKVPKEWTERQAAGRDWLEGFLKRHPSTSLRKPEACCVARSSSFNQANIQDYFKRLETVLKRHPKFLDGTRLYNLDETGTTTVACVGKVLAPKGQKQIYHTSSEERGTLISTCLIIGANGTFLPPNMIFPRAKFKACMLTGGYPGTLRLASPSGWMNTQLFPQVLLHFVKHTSSSIENPSLILLDNHESHLSIGALDIAKQNGVTILILVPHTSHKTQPLDVSVMGPFKKAYGAAMGKWHREHPGEKCTIYDVAQLVNSAISKSVTPGNISGFKASGIHPLDPSVFNELDLMPSNLTDRDCPENKNDSVEEAVDSSQTTESSTSGATRATGVKDLNNTLSVQDHSFVNLSLTPVCSSTPTARSNSSLSLGSKDDSFIGPESFKGYPKPRPRKRKRTARQRGRSRTATDTPEKKAIKERHKAAEKKKSDKIARLEARKKESRPKPKSKNKKTKRINAVLFESEESEGSSLDVPEEIERGVSDTESSDAQPDSVPTLFKKLPHSPEGEYVLIEFTVGKKLEKEYFVGKVIREVDSDGDVEVSYLRKSATGKDKFCLPYVPDIAVAAVNGIKMILPKPSYSGTKRQQNLLDFNVDLSSLNVK